MLVGSIGSNEGFIVKVRQGFEELLVYRQLVELGDGNINIKDERGLRVI